MNTAVWLTPRAYELLHEELRTLQSYCPESDFADDNAEVVRGAQRKRVQQIHDVLVHAVVGEQPPNDGIAEPGMVVTVRFPDGDTETFLLGVHGADYGEIEAYSVDSPLGAAICGARTGEQRACALPDGSVVQVRLERAVPYGLHDRQP